ncbi:MAG TPA: HAMP domain-containing sensor histidine kinase [Saprospiraceae bacterium]|nr:HAMP domain-containing sensor histidine kinase [Saprospiraceae bacterium]
MKLSFRNRIALFTAVAAAATLGLVFLVVYGVVYLTAYNHLDDDIRQEKEEVLNNLRWTGDSIIIESMPEWEEKEHMQIEVNPVFLQVVNRAGKLRFRTSNLQNDILLFDPNLSEEDYFNSKIGDQRIRQGQFPIKNESNAVIGHLTVGISQEESALVLHNLRNTLWIAFPLLLIVLFAATSFAASKGIAPVKKLIRAASGISEANIDSRLPLPENKDEIYQLATTINELLYRIESGMQREKQFTADASHEIRTPLTAIRGTLEVLLRKQRTSEQYEGKISRVIAEVDRLNAMLDQLLQLARLESGHVPINRTPVALDVFSHTLADQWQPRLQEKNMELRLHIPPAVILTTDEALLNIILDNLLGNAIKYGYSGGHIDCIWQPENASLIIRDQGPGIAPEQLPHIFSRFYRADDSRSNTVPGAGLGLSIAKKLADLLGIGLSVSSREGEGTAFVLDFPSETV